MRKSLLSAVLISFITFIGFGQVTLQYWFWDANFEQQELEMIEKFEKTHPDIKVELTALSADAYWTKLAAMAAAKQMPDVMAMHPNTVEDLADQGALLDLSGFVDESFKKYGDYSYFLSVLDSSFKIKDKYYGVPFAWVGSVVYYNKDLFDKYGVEYPTDGWTWDEFLEKAKALTKDVDGNGKTDQWGYTVFSRYAVFDGWVLQNDGDYINRETMRWDPDQNARDTISFVNDLVNKYHVAPRPKDYDLDGKKIKIMFANQQTAMMSEGSWNIKYMREDIPADFNWDIAYLPRGPQWKEDVMHAWADGLAIANNTKYPEESWEFIEFLVNERLAKDYYAGKVPFAKKEAYSADWKEYETFGKLPEHKTLILDYGTSAKHFYTKYWKFWRGYASAEGSGLSAHIDDMLNGDITLEQFYQKSDREINRMLKKAYK